jgi:hypothetical protein
MKINPIVYGVIVLAVFFGIILGFQAAGIWTTSGKVDASGQAIQPLAADVNTIKGWMTLEQIAVTYNAPLADLIKQFALPTDIAPTTAIKDLESDTFDTTALKDWLLSRSQPAGTPPVTAATPVPTQAATPVPGASTPAAVITTAPVSTEHVAPVKTITGKTTFQELLDWGVTKENIQKVIAGDIPVPSTVIKDYVTGKGLEFTTIKTQLQAEVDKTK